MAIILVIDDRAVNREFLITLLKYGKHELVEAANGSDALKFITDKKPDLIITDILMPTMNGYDFVKQLRSNPLYSSIPIIFYTATYRLEEAKLLAQECDVIYVLTKPTDPRIILQVVDQALRHETTLTMSDAPEKNTPLKTPEEKHLLGAQWTHAFNQFEEMNGLENVRDQIRKDPSQAIKLCESYSRALNQFKEISGKLSAIIELILDLSAEHEPEKMLQLFCNGACKIIGSRYCVLGILENTKNKSLKYYHLSASNLQEKHSPILPNLNRGYISEIINKKSMININQMNADCYHQLHLPDSIMPCFLGLPLITANNLYGFVYFSGKLDSNEFSDNDVRIANTLASQISQLYENIELYDTLQKHNAKLQITVSRREHSEEANQAKNVFLMSMSHELLTPLNGILGMTELLLGSELSTQQRKDLNTLRSSANQLFNIIHQILDLAAFDKNEIKLDYIDFNLEDLINDVSTSFKKECDGKHIIIKHGIEPNVPRSYRGDYIKILQVLLNLIGNAIKFLEQGEISINIKLHKKQKKTITLYFEIIDTGIGITSEARSHLFKIFSQGDATMTRKYGGMGIGLFMTKRLIDILGGKIDVMSVPGRGSKFYFTVPLLKKL